MKETKVYVDELPESCAYCPCCSCDLKPEFIKIGDFMYCNLLKQRFRFKEERKKLKDCPLIDIKTHDKEILEEQREKTFILYLLLYQELEKQDIENVASRIDYLTGKDYSDICELYKIAKNIKQHDKELVEKVLEKVKSLITKYDLLKDWQSCAGYFMLDKIIDQIEQEFENNENS